MSETRAVSFGDLSPELIVNILHYCECQTILRFATICKGYHELVSQSISLQLHIELEANGLEVLKGSPKQDATYSEMLEDLRRFRDAWLNLDVREPATRPLGDSTQLFYELQGGYFIRAISQSGGVGDDTADTLEFIPFDVETPKLPLLRFDLPFSCFTTDPEQDLITTISVDRDRLVYLFSNTISYISLYSMATGLAHPLAPCPRITIEFDFELPSVHPVSDYTIEIMGHSILAKFSQRFADAYELLIWNWKSGALLHRIGSRQGICEPTFLNQRYLAVLSVNRLVQNSLALLIYDISVDCPIYSHTPHEPLRVADFPASHPILCLEFPRIKESCRISQARFMLRSGPTPGRPLHTKSAAFVCPHAMTLSAVFNFLVSDYTTDEERWEGPQMHHVFIDVRSLLNHIRTNSQNRKAVIPWTSWGPSATRWFLSQGSASAPVYWPCWMSGSKHIRRLSSSLYSCIVDFSPIVVHRFQDRFAQLYKTTIDGLIENGARGFMTGGGVGGLKYLEGCLQRFIDGSSYHPDLLAVTVGADNPSIIQTSASRMGFDETITSSLPYRLVCKPSIKKDHQGWQIIGDCIVGVDPWVDSGSITIYKLNS